MQKLLKFKTLIVLLILILPAVGALFMSGYFGASDDMHPAWLYQFDKALSSGQIPPRYAPDLSYGFGYPLFNFVFPLPFYIEEIFYKLGFSLVYSIKAVFLVSVIFSAVGMYHLLRNWIGSLGSLAGALVYTYTPYRSTDIYIRGAVPESLAFVFFPLITLSILKAAKLRWVAIGAISLAGLILCHNITAYMFFPFSILLMVIWTFSSKGQISTYVKHYFLMIAGGLLCSSYFWIPALIENNLMRYDTVFNFKDHFPYLRQLVTPYFGYGASVPGLGDGMSFFMGIPNLIILVITILVISAFRKVIKKETSSLIIWCLVGIIVSIFMMNYRSTFIWENIPLIAYFQFPWRFLSLAAFFSSILIICLNYLPYSKFLYITIIIITLVVGPGYFRPEDFLQRDDNYYIGKYIPALGLSSSDYQSQEVYLPLPKVTQKAPEKIMPILTIDKGEGSIEIKQLKDLDIIFTTDSKTDLLVSYNKYYFPGWVAKMDDRKHEISPGTPFGQININIPSGMHKINISFEETTLKTLLGLLSLLSFVSILFVSIKPEIIKNEQ